MSRLGLKDEYVEIVTKIKTYEQVEGLKERHKKRGRIPDYKKNTRVETVDLSQYASKVFTFINNYIINNPKYVNMLSKANVSNIQEELNYAFTEGMEGNLLSQAKLTELAELAA